MTRRLPNWLSALGLAIALAALASPARAQLGYVDEVTEITASTTAQSLYSYSSTSMSYSICGYYTPAVHATVFENGAAVYDDTETGNETCAAVFHNSGLVSITLGDTYVQTANHSVFAIYTIQVYNDNRTYFYNPNHFASLSPHEPYPDEYAYYPDDYGDYYILERTFDLGMTQAEITAAAPTISDISPNVGTIGTTGSIAVSGEYLIDPWTHTATPAIAGTGVSLSVGANPTDQDLTLNYSIAQGATAGPQSLTLATRFGTSNAATFTVGYPAAHIASLSPTTWQAGSSFTLTINGTGFGTAPTVNISGVAGVQYGQAMNTNPLGTQTHVSVTIEPDAPDGTATVTVIPGYAGSTFYCGNCNGGSPNGTDTATVVAAQNSCPAALDAHSGFVGVVSTGTTGGAGTMTASFSGGVFNGSSVTVPYGQYSTPESIASHIAALITKNYYASGLSAQAVGSYILYKSTAVLGTPALAVFGQSFVKDASTACPPANLKYVLAVQSDSVVWLPVPRSTQRGRQVTYIIKKWPTAAQTTFWSLTSPSYSLATITEHLTATGYTSSNYNSSEDLRSAGQFADVLGSSDITYGHEGVFQTGRWFSVVLDGQPVSGSIMTFDKAGKHLMDDIEIHMPSGPSFLNNYKNADGTPKDVSLD